VREGQVIGQPSWLSLPLPSVVVLRSPTPSRVRIGADSKGLGKNALGMTFVVIRKYHR
jgi:hypothetical protein